MKWLVGVLVMCATASAQRIEIPAGFTKRSGGGDEYKKLARAVKVQVYAAGDVELTTILLELAPAAKTTAAIDQFDRDLVAKTTVGNHVSDTRSFDRDPVLAEAFDQTAKDRIYHRKLYAIDAKGLGHLWWTVCKGPATAIGVCEEAQRTMRLDVVNTLPAPPAAKPAPQPIGTPLHPDGQPWSFQLPFGFEEVPGAGEEQAKQLRLQPAMRSVDVRAYKSDKPKAVISMMNAVVAMGDDLSWENLEKLDHGAVDAFGDQTNHSAHLTRRERAGDYLISEAAGDAPQGLHVEVRTIYGADSNHDVHWFTMQCWASAADLAACRGALQSMQLVIPDVATPTSQPTRSAAYRAGEVVGGILVILIVASIPIGIAVWIFRRDRRDRRRRRAPL